MVSGQIWRYTAVADSYEPCGGGGKHRRRLPRPKRYKAIFRFSNSKIWLQACADHHRKAGLEFDRVLKIGLTSRIVDDQALRAVLVKACAELTLRPAVEHHIGNTVSGSAIDVVAIAE